MAVVTVRIPLKDLDHVTELVDMIVNGSRWLRMRSRASQAASAARAAFALNRGRK